ncbi:hypothetical protein PM082_004687 [Marasmius tenuissimus]|nr:hypothetical protein PM082_004687 [Marasmius tenuissimus]
MSSNSVINFISKNISIFILIALSLSVFLGAVIFLVRGVRKGFFAIDVEVGGDPQQDALDKHGDKLAEVVDRFNREKPILSRRLLSKNQLIYSWPRHVSELEHNVSASTRNEEKQKRMPASKSFESVFLPWEEGVAEGFIAVPIAIEHMAEFMKMGLRVVDPKVDAVEGDSKPSNLTSKQVDLIGDCWWADGRHSRSLRPSVSTGSVGLGV